VGEHEAKLVGMDVDKLSGVLRQLTLYGAATDDSAIVRAQWQLSRAPLRAHLRAA
jgi:hypothetical protein